jgi:hypothetical protein
LLLCVLNIKGIPKIQFNFESLAVYLTYLGIIATHAVCLKHIREGFYCIKPSRTKIFQLPSGSKVKNYALMFNLKQCSISEQPVQNNTHLATKLKVTKKAPMKFFWLPPERRLIAQNSVDQTCRCVNYLNVEILKLCTVHHSLRQTYRRVAELRH